MLPGHAPAHPARLVGGHLRPGERELQAQLIVLLAALLAACSSHPGTGPSERPRGGGWVCGKTSCEQGYPRLPDDGQWECADLDGVVVCRGGGPAAGTVPGPPDPGWRCGARPDGERLCIDLAPEFPDDPRESSFTGRYGSPTGLSLEASRAWLCHYGHSPVERRVCERDEHGPPVGAPCGAGCAEDTRCVEGRCALVEPRPGCWLDEDCNGGRCLHGSCR